MLVVEKGLQFMREVAKYTKTNGKSKNHLQKPWSFSVLEGSYVILKTSPFLAKYVGFMEKTFQAVVTRNWPESRQKQSTLDSWRRHSRQWLYGTSQKSGRNLAGNRAQTILLFLPVV
ncbi:unnamed protein product [Victoria cruziana]